MQKKNISFYSNFLTSGYSFGKDELLLRFQYQMLNTILLVMALFSLMFAIISTLGINPIGTIHTTMDYILSTVSIILIVRLRGGKARYKQCTYLMYIFAFITFISALLFVPDDEFRIIWFYLLVVAAYIVGDIYAGNLITVASIVTIIVVNLFYDLELSQTTIVSAVLGLIILSLFIRAYAKKIINFEKEIIEQQNFIIEQSRFAAMGEMMSMIAHQWRQPLSTTTLLIANERVNSIMEGKESSKYDEIFERISDTMVYLSETIDDFQTYFKPEKSAKNVEINSLVERARQFTEHRLIMANIKMSVIESKKEYLDTYANEIVQVLINIINNAADVLVQREIHERKIWISIDSSDEEISISIEDNAGGIESDILERIFEPYFSSKSENGTGLGLYMSKMIIDTHINGSIDVINSSRGARFTIVIPKKSS
ncbi:MAG: HAMP domain-containing sensor histidine kinase [Campylobacterota bacterium]